MKRFVPVVLLVALAGCTARRIREAQDSFNDASAAESRARAERSAESAAQQDLVVALGGYRLTVAALDAELDRHEGDLKDEGLFGNALVLRALALWRLSDLEDGDTEAARAVRQRFDEVVAALASVEQSWLGTRDRVLVRALPGLRDHDRGLRAANYERAKEFFSSAVGVLGEAVTAVNPPRNHPVRDWIVLARLSSCRAWHAAIFQFLAAGEDRVREDSAALAAAEKVCEESKDRWSSDPAFRQLVNELRQRIGLSPLP